MPSTSVTIRSIVRGHFEDGVATTSASSAESAKETASAVVMVLLDLPPRRLAAEEEDLRRAPVRARASLTSRFALEPPAPAGGVAAVFVLFERPPATTTRVVVVVVVVAVVVVVLRVLARLDALALARGVRVVRGVVAVPGDRDDDVVVLARGVGTGGRRLLGVAHRVSELLRGGEELRVRVRRVRGDDRLELGERLAHFRRAHRRGERARARRRRRRGGVTRAREIATRENIFLSILKMLPSEACV